MDDAAIIKAIGTKKLLEIFDRSKGAISYWRKNGIPDTHRKYLKLLYSKLFEASLKSKKSSSVNHDLDYNKSVNWVLISPQSRGEQ